MKNEILVSVIVPTYNQSEFLELTLLNIINQKTNFHYEMIISNDASTDNSDSVIQEDNNAVGENYGTIRTKANSTKTGMIDVVLLNGSIIKNYNQIIVEGNDNIGIFTAKTYGGYSILIRHSFNLCRRFGAAIQSVMLRLSKAGTGCVMTERLLDPNFPQITWAISL